ncbi:MAG: hypothetical protein ACOVOQ_01155 [Flavobacterium sp.]|jgi:hypothetical protein
MTNKENFIKNCLLVTKSSDLVEQNMFAKIAIDTFLNSKYIDNTTEESKLFFIQNLKEVLNNYINKSSTVNDVKQMITLQSDIIVD